MSKEQTLGSTLLKGSAIFAIGNIFHKISVVASMFIVLRYIPVYDYGLWQLVLGLIGLVGLISLPGMEEVFLSDISRLIGRGKHKTGRLVFLQFSLLLVITSFLAMGVFIAAPYVLDQFTGIALHEILVIASLYFPFFAANRILTTFFNSRLAYLTVQKLQAVSRIVYIALLVLFLVVLDSGLATIVYAFTFTPLVASIIFLPRFIRVWRSEVYEVDERVEISLKTIMRGHGKWALAARYVDHFLQSIRPWILGFFLGVEGLAIISIAQSFFGEFSQLIPLNNVLGSAFARHIDKSVQEMKSILHTGVKYIVLLYSLAVIPITLLMYPLTNLIFPQYILSTPLLMIMLIALPIAPILSITTKLFYADLKQKELFLVNMFPKAASLVLTIVLAFSLGLVGVAIERVVSYYLAVYCKMRGVKKYMPQVNVFGKGMLGWRYGWADFIYTKNITNKIFSSFKIRG